MSGVDRIVEAVYTSLHIFTGNGVILGGFTVAAGKLRLNEVLALTWMTIAVDN
jgi:hypothetical protein